MEIFFNTPIIITNLLTEHNVNQSNFLLVNEKHPIMKKLLISIIATILGTTAYSQTVDGPSPVMGGSTQMYTYSGPSIYDPVWQCSNCTIVSSYGLSVSVTWGTTAIHRDPSLFLTDRHLLPVRQYCFL